MTDALGSSLFYIGALTGLVGLLNVIRPFRWSRIRTRRRAALVAATGLALIVGATLLPNQTRTASARDTLIDQWLPEWQFREYHERRVRGTPREVFDAIRQVRSSDIFLFRTLTFIRNPLRQDQRQDILNAPGDTPILDVALAGGFVLLGETDSELLIGAVVIAPPGLARGAQRGNVSALNPARFRTLERPGFARAVMNFRVIPEADGWTRVTTETRVHAVDTATRRQFTRYWRAIFPGSWIIRWSWLRAIEARR
ncbi:MAG: hypothetical protein M3Q55_09450 [Acidobacteriota bacterium]|nr:hypothetical protein [Acidobacteriota bacterium]